MSPSDFKHPRLKADRRVDVVGDVVFLTSEGRHYLLEGEPVAAVIKLLDGTRTVADIAEALSAAFSLGQVIGAIAKLTAAGHVVEGPVEGDPAGAAWWDHLGVGAMEARSRLASGGVGVTGFGRASAPLSPQLCSMLESARVCADATELAGADGRLAVVLVDDYLDPHLSACNAALLGAAKPWLLARAVGTQLWLGPLFVPGQTGCWACLAQRLAANRQVERFVDEATGEVWTGQQVASALPATLQVGLGLVAVEAQRVLAEGTSPNLAGAMVTIDLVNMVSQRHILVRQPQCPACGEPGCSQPTGAVALSPQPKAYGDDGGHRVTSPSATIALLDRHMSPLIGAISGLHRLTPEGDEVCHTYAAGHNFAMLSRSTYLLRRNIRGQSGGKGRTDTQARASAMCEAIERYSGVWRGDEPRVRTTLAELGAQAVHPASLLDFSDRQYAGRREWNAKQRSGLHMVPERFDPERPVDWSAAWSLTHDQRRYVPTAYCYFGHPDLVEHPYCYCDANGNAAGNTIEEAALQGLLELVERDSVAIWWYNRLRAPAVELGSLDGYDKVLSRYYARQGRSLWVLDITTDLGVPSFAAVSQRTGHPVEDIVLGFGAHVEPELGAMRALTEANQFLPGVMWRDAKGETVYGYDDPEALDWWRHAHMQSEPYLVADPTAAPASLPAMPNLACDDITEELRRLVQRLASAGIEVIVLDQSRPDLDLKVAKVMAPGLRHFWRRLGPGRLYDAPVAMGRLGAPLAETELNPKSVFF